jgi:hypothetical protein
LATTSAEFGFYPLRLDLIVGNVQIESLPNFSETTEGHESWEGVEKGWIYPGFREERSFTGIRQLPYASRVFGLPKTHCLTHGDPSGAAHLPFLVWCLSFLLGMRLTTTEAGFLDATPIKTGTLVDFICRPSDVANGLGLAEAFWQQHLSNPDQPKRLIAAINALFIAQHPQRLQFEEFIYLYTALDSCFALLKARNNPPKNLKHGERVEWMCGLFGMTTPQWAHSNGNGQSDVAVLRNDALHEALFVDEPLGFAVHGIGSGLNLMLEMRVLVCRLLIAIMGGGHATYVRSPVNTRSVHLLDLG